MIQKGLQLIAQFNFQRTPGVSTHKNHFPVQGTKNLSAESSIFGSSDFQIVSRQRYFLSQRGLSTAFSDSLLLPLKSEENVAKSKIRARVFLNFFYSHHSASSRRAPGEKPRLKTPAQSPPLHQTCRARNLPMPAIPSAYLKSAHRADCCAAATQPAVFCIGPSPRPPAPRT